MNSKNNLSFRALGVLSFSLTITVAPPVLAAGYQWDTNGNALGLGGSGNWTDANWDDTALGVNDGTETPASYTFTTADSALFGGTAGTVTVASGIKTGTLKFDTGGYTLSGGGIELYSGTWAWGTYSTHDIIIGAGKTVTINSNLTNTGGKDVAISSGVSGAGTGSGGVMGGTVVLGGVNTFSNDLYVFGSTVEVGNVSALGFASGKGLVLRNWEIGTGNGADASAVSTFRYTGGTATFSKMNGNGGQSLIGGGKFVFDITQSGTTLTLDQAMLSNNNRANTLEKTGAGTLTLTGANTYSNTVAGTTGGTIITDGTVAFNSGSLGGSGAVTMNGGTLKWNGTNTQDISSRLTLIAGKSANFDTNGNNVTLASAIGGGTTAAVTKTGTGTLSLSGNNTYTGATTILTGTLEISGAGQLGGGSYAGTVTNNAILKINSTANQTLSGVIDGTGTLVKSNTGMLILSNANTYAGGTTVNGGAISLGNAAGLGTGAVSISNGAKLTIGTLTASNPVTLGPGGGNLAGGTGDYGVFTGKISGGTAGANSLVINSGHVELRNPANDFAGNINLAGAYYLRTAISETVPDTAVINLTDSAAGFKMFSNTAGTITETIAGINSSVGGYGVFAEATGQPVVANLRVGYGDVSSNYNGPIWQYSTATLNLEKIGAGTLTLSGTSTYTGATTISAGILEISGAGRLGGGNYAGNITNHATLKINTTASQTLSGVIDGTGALVKSNTGTLTLSNANTYAGGTTITDGTVAFNNGSLGSSGAITMDGGTLKWNGTNTQDISSRLTLIDGKTANLDTNGNNVTLASSIGGGTTASLNKTGSGTLTLAGNSSNYTGSTIVSAGTLYLSGSLAGTLEVGTDATITGNGTVGGALMLDSGANLDLTNASLLVNGTSTGILSVASGQTITLGNFNFTDIVGWDYANAALGVYTLINGGSSVIFGGSSPTSIADAYDFGNGKKGYFQQGSLQAVIIPEPGTTLLGTCSLAMLALLCRRRNGAD